MIVSGLAVPYNIPARLEGDAYETQFSPGCFATSIREGSVECWVNHKWRSRVSAQGEGLGLCDDVRGLFFAATIAAGRWPDIIGQLAALHLLNGASVGIGPARSFRWSAGVKIVDDCVLKEISICLGSARPAFPTYVRAA